MYMYTVYYNLYYLRVIVQFNSVVYKSIGLKFKRPGHEFQLVLKTFSFSFFKYIDLPHPS